MKRSDTINWTIFILIFFGLIVVCWILRSSHPLHLEQWSLPGWAKEQILARVENFIGSWSLLAIGIYPFAVLGILLLERLMPARPEQKTLSTGLVHDAAWVLIRFFFQLAVIVWYLKLLRWLYLQHLDFLTVTSLSELPEWARFLVAALLLDFARWLSHFINHKVPAFWCFHAVHHAQRELNLFSDYRIHFMEFIFSGPIFIVPFMMLDVGAPKILAYSLFLSWHARLYHSNIKSNFGPLKYLLVTPQSHRVHHSSEKAHRDTNFGALLSVWDYLLGTQYRRYNEYPRTGISDESFPQEESVTLRSVLVIPVLQIIYPFRQIAQWLGVRSK